MVLTDLDRMAVGVGVLVVSTAIVGGAGRPIEVWSQAGTQVPVVSNEPEVQRWVEAQLGWRTLDPNARVASLNLTAKPLREIVDAVAQAGGIIVRYASGTTGLDSTSTVTLQDQTVEDALRVVLKGHVLTFQALGPKTAFIYTDTPANREKYTPSIRVFPIAKADPTILVHQLNRELTQRPATEGFRPMFLTVRDSRIVIVRAIPENMVWIATWIGENDKTQASRGR